MGKKKYIIRLYKTHDRDLLTFVETHRFSLVKAMYCSLKAFCNKDLFFIKIPPINENQKVIDKKIYATTLSLDEDKDSEAIALLEKIKDGKKNNFLKNLLRLYLCHPLSTDFLKKEEDITLFDELFNVFRDGKRVANAAEMARNKETGKKKEIKAINEKKPKEQEIKVINMTPVYEKQEKEDTKEEETYIESKPKNTYNGSDDDILDAFTSLF